MAPRVAFLPDSYLETNGAARTCRELAAFARRRGLPFLLAHFGAENRIERNGIWRLEFQRSPLGFPVDADLAFDLTFYRLRDRLERALRSFGAQVIHITSPGELGILGAILAARLKLPLVASWHTNVHEFASRRTRKVLSWMPAGAGEAAARWAENSVLDRLLWLFGRSEVILAPNDELIELIHRRTGKPVHRMERGIDTETFTPERRDRRDGLCVLGHIGRLMPEKNVRLLVEVERRLAAAGRSGFRFFVAGHGSEERWLRANLKNADFDGILPPDALARAYANMDVFLFPSLTDTFGNVAQEALASGVPAVVMDAGGPKYIVRHGVSGLVASSAEEFVRHAERLMDDPELRRRMGRAGREQMLGRSWDSAFEVVCEAYREAVERRARRTASV
jgi:glycosyltransferase involved in cell wall biosynthesis